MSKERDVISVGTDSASEDTVAELSKMTRAEKKARLAYVLDRGVIHDRLAVKLPSNLHGEWIRNDPLEIHRMHMLGFRVDTEYAASRAINSDGTPGNQVGDVIFMICEKETKELIDEVRNEQTLRANRDPKAGKEEKEFAAQTHAATGGEIPTFIESKQRAVHPTDLASTMSKISEQTSIK